MNTQCRLSGRLPGSRITAALAGVLWMAALLAGTGSIAEAKDLHRVTGKVFIQQVQVAFVGSGAAGTGRLVFRGRSYPFKVAGLGVGGIGISKLTASGDVYDLKRLSDFEGLYGQARLGWAVARRGRGQMWLANGKGVTLKLTAQRRGLMVAGGADGVDIRFAH